MARYCTAGTPDIVPAGMRAGVGVATVMVAVTVVVGVVVLVVSIVYSLLELVADNFEEYLDSFENILEDNIDLDSCIEIGIVIRVDYWYWCIVDLNSNNLVVLVAVVGVGIDRYLGNIVVVVDYLEEYLDYSVAADCKYRIADFEYSFHSY